MVDEKMRTDVYILYGGTGSSVTSGKRIPRNKGNMKSPAMYPLRNYLIPNHYINRLITKNIQLFHHI